MLIEECKLIPQWLVESLDDTCPYCGNKYHVGLSPNMARVTNHYCPNLECPATIAMKMVFMWDILSVTGIKSKKSLELCKTHRLTNHMQAIPKLLKDKPTVSLVNYLRMNCVKGIDSAWGEVCKDAASVEDVVKTDFVRINVSIEDIQSIINNQEYVNIVYPKKTEYEPVLRATVMITGNIDGFDNREWFVAALNFRYKGLLSLGYSKSKRSTGIYALIKEEGSAITEKVNVAMRNNIPVMTAGEFVVHIDKVIRERSGVNFDD